MAEHKKRTVRGYELVRKGDDYVACIEGYWFVFERHPTYWRIAKNTGSQLGVRDTLEKAVYRARRLARFWDRTKEDAIRDEARKKAEKRSAAAKKSWRTRKANAAAAKSKARTVAKKKAGIKTKPKPKQPTKKKERKVRVKLGRADAPWA